MDCILFISVIHTGSLAHTGTVKNGMPYYWYILKKVSRSAEQENQEGITVCRKAKPAVADSPPMVSILFIYIVKSKPLFMYSKISLFIHFRFRSHI